MEWRQTKKLGSKKRSNSLCRKQRRRTTSGTSTSRHRTKHPSYRKTRRKLKQFRTLQDPSGEVVNLSNKLFTRYEFKLLNKGLSFSPTPKQYNRINFSKDLQTFLRRIKLRAHFGIDDHEHEPTEEEIFGFKQKSNWTPRFNNHTVDTFIAAVTNDISNSQIKKCPKDNLTKEERKALQRLKERQDIVITKADKGGATVIWDVEDYIRESERQLKNENFYRKNSIIILSRNMST